MSPEDYKILQARIDSKKVPLKDRAIVEEKKPYQKVATVNKKYKGSKEKGEMELILMGLFPNSYQKEFQFSKEEGRKFRFDYYIPLLKIGIEYEGLGFKPKGEKQEESWHTNVVGYTSNCEKYNLAQILGFKVLRYTAKNYTELGSDLLKLI